MRTATVLIPLVLESFHALKNLRDTQCFDRLPHRPQRVRLILKLLQAMYDPVDLTVRAHA